MSPTGSMVQWRFTTAGFGFNTCSVVQQQFGDIRVAAACRNVEGRLTPVVLGIDVGFLGKKDLCHGLLSRVSGPV